MKYAAVLLAGILVGVALFIGGMYYNPIAEGQAVSPITISAREQLAFTYSAVPEESLLYTYNGDSVINTHPDRVAKLREPTLVDTRIFVTILDDSRGRAVGLGIKFSSNSEQSVLINSQALVNSVWHIYLTGQGTMFVDQIENFWSYLREIVVPARWSSGDSWKGSFFRIMTQGPGALGTARVTGGSGKFDGMSSEAVESLTARAYSALDGPVSMSGSLTMTVPTSVSLDD